MTNYKYIDELFLYNNAKQYHRNWKSRCSNCLAPCCFFSVSGYEYDYKLEDKGTDNSRNFWTNDFVIIAVKWFNEEDIKAWNFNTPLAQNAELNYTNGNKGLQICPLNINSKCFIYEDRPKMCKRWKCVMKTVEGNTLE